MPFERGLIWKSTIVVLQNTRPVHVIELDTDKRLGTVPFKFVRVGNGSCDKRHHERRNIRDNGLDKAPARNIEVTVQEHARVYLVDVRRQGGARVPLGGCGR